jgi:hypothetical protein
MMIYQLIVKRFASAMLLVPIPVGADTVLLLTVDGGVKSFTQAYSHGEQF